LPVEHYHAVGLDSFPDKGEAAVASHLFVDHHLVHDLAARLHAELPQRTGRQVHGSHAALGVARAAAVDQILLYPGLESPRPLAGGHDVHVAIDDNAPARAAAFDANHEVVPPPEIAILRRARIFRISLDVLRDGTPFDRKARVLPLPFEVRLHL
jgi:hypothetical protein